jgi:hypothetical protein
MGSRTESREIVRKLQVDFPADAQGNVVLKINDKTCNLNLVTHVVSNCQSDVRDVGRQGSKRRGPGLPGLFSRERLRQIVVLPPLLLGLACGRDATSPLIPIRGPAAHEEIVVPLDAGNLKQEQVASLYHSAQSFARRGRS